MAENQNIEYKSSWRDEYLKWVCGFANAGGGTAILKPDAHLLSAARGSAYERLWFLEIDMGSESPATIRRKAEVYEAYRRTGIEQSRNGAFPMVAWIAPDERRGASCVAP